MDSINADLASILQTVQTPGDFFAAGECALHVPLIEVDSVGPIALPVLPAQAAQLIAVAERAPYGRGADTLVDTAVRRTWQIGADRVHIKGRHWNAMLEGVVEIASTGLGAGAGVEAELYKLLVYDEGSFFVEHRDTEKSPGMFATLIVALPSLHTGGELVIRHREREARLDLRCGDVSELAWAAFYADCVHEVLPITSGCRLVLVYNLRRKSRGRLPRPPSYDKEAVALERLLRTWCSETVKPDEDQPLKLVYPLAHAYTPAELSFAALKGADAAAATVLTTAAGDAACELHLARRRSGYPSGWSAWTWLLWVRPDNHVYSRRGVGEPRPPREAPPSSSSSPPPNRKAKKLLDVVDGGTWMLPCASSSARASS